MGKQVFILIFFFSKIVMGQTCPQLSEPLNNATNVPVDAIIEWNEVEGVTGYIISIGTFSGGSDILSAQTGSNYYKPPLGLPDNSRIYVTITLFFFNRPNIVCSSQSFFTTDVIIAPNCTTLSGPLNGASNINVATNISWNYASSATGYRISIGTSSGQYDIIDNVDVGNVLQFNPALDLPQLTDIFVRIVPYNENGSLSTCSEVGFTTGEVATLPNCSSIIYPIDGQSNVPLTPFIEWEALQNATAYRVYIGNTPDRNDILDGGVFYRNSTYVLNFESNSIYFIRIVPFNEAGEAIGCLQTTFSTVLGCGPFYDIDTGELTSLNPTINFPDEVSICFDNDSGKFRSPDDADGYRWYFIDANGDEVLISSQREVNLEQEGNYIYEAYNLSEELDSPIECSTFKEFRAVNLGSPIVQEVIVTRNNMGIDILVEVSGNGDYEFSITSEDGPYQDLNVFQDVSSLTESVFIKLKYGCNVLEYKLLNRDMFPKFFTPNGDGVNDYWQHFPIYDSGFTIIKIYVYDQYGKFIKEINANGKGWNGTFNGREMPNSDYWFKAIASNGKVFNGHFTLKR